MSRDLWSSLGLEFDEEWPSDWADSDTLAEALEYVEDSGGKKLRPLVCLETCRELGGELDRAQVFARSVEILHNYTLVHDDIQDGDSMRRGQESVWDRYGEPKAIEVGDALHAMSYQEMVKNSHLFENEELSRLLEVLNTADRRIADGQVMDISFRERKRITEEEYMEMAEKKTGALFEACLLGGAVIAGEQRLEEPLRRYGRKLSTAFQIRDDVIDLKGGKGRRDARDVAEGKRSLVAVKTLNSLGERRRDRLLEILDAPREETSEDQIERAVQLMKSVDAIEEADAVARRRVDEAREALEAIDERHDIKGLEEITDFVVERKF